MSELEKNENRIVSWYRASVRRLLETIEPERVESADVQAATVDKIEAELSREIPVCFLGTAGIGKSTLINALIGDTVIPHGGIGPLTAQALFVRSSDTRAFVAEYHGASQLNKLAFAIEKSFVAAQKKAGTDVKTVLNAPENAEIELDDEAASDDEIQKSRIEELRKQALVMVAGNQDATRDDPYLIDRLLETLGRKPAFGTEPFADDQTRLTRLRGSIDLAKQQTPFKCIERTPEFRSSLHDHAAGFLAPLIDELTVFWPASILQQNVVLVDLPGVGVAGDIHSKVTDQYIRQHAKVLVLVVSVRGFSESEARLLRDSGFLNRLLHSVDDPAADPVKLAIVIVRVDDIAETEHQKNRAVRRSEHFARVAEEAIDRARRQLGAELRNIWATDQELSKGKTEVVDRLTNDVQIFAVSAVQYSKALDPDPESPPFLKDPEQSNIPTLERSLTALAEKLKTDRQARLNNAQGVFFSNLNTSLRVIRERWANENRAEEEAERLRAELAVAIEPIRREFDNRRGAFRSFLREQVPREIALLILDASRVAEKSIDRYLRSLRDAHWATLKAAVTRNGAFYGARNINLPRDFALRFEEPIAEVWGRKLLLVVRKRTKEYADDCVDLIGRILDWAKNRARFKTTLLEALVDRVRADALQLNVVGKERIDELREEVKNLLVVSITGPIEKKCKSFVKRGDAIGRGVKDRILDLFDELSNEVVASAEVPARELITTQFQDVENDIKKILRADSDLISEAADAVVESHETIVKRSDAQRRGNILRQLDEIEAARPKDIDMAA